MAPTSPPSPLLAKAWPLVENAFITGRRTKYSVLGV
eukprot:COSAG02_NODE_62415_length_266_cov_0.604790_1_plen_35_part_10